MTTTRARALVAVSLVGAAACLGEGCFFSLEPLVTTGDGGAAPSGSGGADGAVPERTPITIDAAMLTQSLTDVPVLVTLDPSRVDYSLAGVDGANLRVYAEDGTTQLAHEVERWMDGGESQVWVRLPLVSAGSVVTIYAEVGVPQPDLPPDPSDVWVAYESVFHFADQLPTATVKDSTQAHPATPVGMDASHMTEARIGPGFLFTGGASPTTDPHLDLSDPPELQLTPSDQLTVEVWFERSSPIGELGYLFSMEACCVGWGATFLSTPLQFRSLVGVNDCCGAMPPPANYAYAQFTMPSDSDAAWHHSVTVIDRSGGVIRSYLDGVEAAQTAIPASIYDTSGSLNIGSNFAGEDGFDGTLDELRIARTAVPAAWVSFVYETTLGTGVTYGTPEPLP